jgi:hypothetical protein
VVIRTMPAHLTAASGKTWQMVVVTGQGRHCREGKRRCWGYKEVWGEAARGLARLARRGRGGDDQILAALTGMQGSRGCGDQFELRLC